MDYNQVAHSLRIIGFEENGGSETDWDDDGHTATVWYLQMGAVTVCYYLPHHNVPDLVTVDNGLCVPCECHTLAEVLKLIGDWLDFLHFNEGE